MNSTITVDRAGRIVIPKPVREELQLREGDVLELEKAEGEIILRPLRGAGSMRKKHGIWVLRTGKPLSAETVKRTLQEVRNERSSVAAGLLPPIPKKVKAR